MAERLPDELFESAAGMAGATNYADWTFSLFKPLARGRVFEVGCGVGTFTRRLLDQPAVERVLSIDVSAAAAAHCRRAIADPRLDVRHADLLAIDGAFDLVVCMNVLEHIDNDLAALRHMWDRVAPGGTLFLLVPAHQALFSSFDVESGHFRRYDKRGLTQLLRKAELTPQTIRMFYFNTIGALGYWAVYKLLRKGGRTSAASEVGSFDRLIVPWQRRLEPASPPFGISLVAVATRSRR